MSALAPIAASTAASSTARKVAAPHTMVDYLRAKVIYGPVERERFHVVFLDRLHAILGDEPLGDGASGSLSLRMRDLIGRALALDARGIIIAHNHPSGQCRPSTRDIEATQRLKHIARAVDVELVDHLIITDSAAYSMRAGGNL